MPRFAPSALTSYKTGSGGFPHYKVNAYLREKDRRKAARSKRSPAGRVRNFYYDPDIEKQVAKMSAEMHELPNQDTIELYRGTSVAEFGKGGRIPAVGSTFSCPAFFSTSTNYNVAVHFSKGILLVLKLSPGVRSFDYRGVTSKFKGEDEILLDRGARFQVTRIEENKQEGSIKFTKVHATCIGTP